MNPPTRISPDKSLFREVTILIIHPQTCQSGTRLFIGLMGRRSSPAEWISGGGRELKSLSSTLPTPAPENYFWYL
jgi:hypothetical protein